MVFEEDAKENYDRSAVSNSEWPKPGDPKKPESDESEESYLNRLKEYWDRVNRGEYPGSMPTRGAGHGYVKSGTP